MADNTKKKNLFDEAEDDEEKVEEEDDEVVDHEDLSLPALPERFLRDVNRILSNGDSDYEESLSLPSLEESPSLSTSPSLPSLVPSNAVHNERFFNRRGREDFQVVEVGSDVDMDSDLSNGDSEFEDVDSIENLREGTGMVASRVESVMIPGSGMSDLDGYFGVLAFLMHDIAISHDSPDDDSN